MRMDSAVRKREEPAQEGEVLAVVPAQAEPPARAPEPGQRRWRIPRRYRGQAIAFVSAVQALSVIVAGAVLAVVP